MPLGQKEGTSYGIADQDSPNRRPETPIDPRSPYSCSLLNRESGRECLGGGVLEDTVDRNDLSAMVE